MMMRGCCGFERPMGVFATPSSIDQIRFGGQDNCLVEAGNSAVGS